jgi:hypothetical protein
MPTIIIKRSHLNGTLEERYSLEVTPRSRAQLDMLVALLTDMLPNGTKVEVHDG